MGLMLQAWCPDDKSQWQPGGVLHRAFLYGPNFLETKAFIYYWKQLLISGKQKLAVFGVVWAPKFNIEKMYAATVCLKTSHMEDIKH